MNPEEQPHRPLKNRLFSIGLIYLVGFTMFFFASLIIITVNVKTRQKVKVPLMIGKMYIDEHNNLMNLGLQVELEQVNFVEYPYGYILAQNISAGQVVKEGALLLLTVNQSKSIVPVPDLVGVSESIVEKLLVSVAVGNATYSLFPGIKTRIPSDRPAGEVLVQFPPSGTPVIPETPISMLISDGPEKLKTGFIVPDLRNVNIEVVKMLSYNYHVPIKIVPVKTYDFRKNGLIDKVDFGPNGMFMVEANPAKSSWTVYVNKYDEQGPDFYPNEMVWVDLKNSDTRGKLVTIYEKSKKGEEVFSNPAFTLAGDSWPVFYQAEMSLSFWEGYHEGSSLFGPDKKKTLRSPKLEKTIRGAEI